MKQSPISLLVGISLLTLGACGGSDDDGGGGVGPQCSSGSCGEAKDRRAIPTGKAMLIGFAGKSGQRKLLRNTPAESQRTQASSDVFLAATSPGFLSVEDHINDINEDMTDIVDAIAAVADREPEIDDEGLAVWRADIPAYGVEAIVAVATDDELTYHLTFELGEAGFAQGSGAALIDGEMIFADAEDDEADSFHLDIDFDAVQAVATIPDQGKIVLAAQPFGDGGEEVWYDFVNYTDGTEPAETSRTTYWTFDEDDVEGAVEFVGSQDDGSGLELTVFARWGANGGRLDFHATYDDQGEAVDEIHTDCWDDSAAQEFDATAWFSDGEDFAYLEGEEASCQYGPLEGHPNATTEFSLFPAEGEWDAIDATWIDCDAEPESCEP